MHYLTKIISEKSDLASYLDINWHFKKFVYEIFCLQEGKEKIFYLVFVLWIYTKTKQRLRFRLQAQMVLNIIGWICQFLHFYHHWKSVIFNDYKSQVVQIVQTQISEIVFAPSPIREELALKIWNGKFNVYWMVLNAYCLNKHSHLQYFPMQLWRFYLHCR